MSDLVNPTSTLSSKLSRKMTLQACMIGLVAILSIGFASVVIEQFLVRQALIAEADHYWEIYRQDASKMPPNTANLKGFLAPLDQQSALPEELRGYDVGFHKMHGQFAHSLMYIDERGEQRLTLLFDGKSVTRLALVFGILPLVIVLCLIYLTSWWIYRESNFLLSPIVWLANRFDKFDPAHPEANLADLSEMPGDVDWEIEKLAKSLSIYSKRIKRFVERERAFTRDASHEFRTPLTVIKMASDLVLAEPNLDPYIQKNATRIRGAARDMEELISAFLILARETNEEFVEDQVDVIDVVRNEVEDASVYLDDKPVEIVIDEQYPLELETAQKVVSIVLGNLIRNAVIYTEEGSVTISIKQHSVEIKDTGIGMCEEQIKKIFQPYYRANTEGKYARKGYGVGLTIVKRLSNRFNWVVTLQSKIGEGTSMEVLFDENEV